MMTKIEFDLLSHTACNWDEAFINTFEPIEYGEPLKTDFKNVYFYSDFPSVLWAKQYLREENEPFQIVNDDMCEYAILCNVRTW